MTDCSDILQVNQLQITFRLQRGELDVVRGVSFRVPRGKTVALVGESGSGKTVISQAVMGLLPKAGSIRGGQILFHDPLRPGAAPADIAAMPRDGREIRHLRGGRIGMIFQEPMSSLSPVHTIGDQIEEALRLHRPTPHGEARAVTESMLEMVGFKNPHRSYRQYPFELSGGLRQRAMLAMALICHPALLIADEPTTALDVTIQAQVLSLMRSLQSELGMSILLITHDLGVVANMADEVVVIYHGEIMEAGSREDIFRNPQHPYLKALLAALPHFDMKPGQRLVSLRDTSGDLGPLVATRRRLSAKEAPVSSPSTPLLRVRGLRKTYPGKRSGLLGKRGERAVAVADVSFDIHRGECLGLVGESGSGKTSVGKLIMRALKADAGQVIFDNGAGPVDVLALHGDEGRRFRRSIQMIFQDPVSSLSPRMTVLNIIREPMEIHHQGPGKTQRAADLMNAVGLDRRFLNRYPHSFSGGQRQRIGIARALALNPDLIICDEPVSALDVSVQAQVLNLLKDLQRELGLTYLFISHNLAVVDYIAQRIAVLANGRIVEIAPREILFRAPAHTYTQALLKAVPFPDLDHPLDFTSVTLRGASNPSHWAPQFRDDGDPATLMPIDLGHGHMVLARGTVDRKDLVA